MKKTARFAALAALALSVAACTTATDVAPPVTSRDAPIDTAQPATGVARMTQSYRISDLDVVVPRTLRVSEANVYYPNADIVWRGDLPGDRYKQIEAIFEAGIKRGATRLDKGVPADLKIEIMRFHSLTEKTRYSFGGTHSIKFRLTLSDPKTGAVLETRVVDADLKAYGGSKAIAMEAQGWGQKARITQHLANVTARELSGRPTSG